jgi:Zn-dependent protease
VLAAFNLLPVRPLDGSMAWRIVPEFIKRVKNRNKKKASAAGWR